jgi:hypothetical protein
MEFVSSDGWLGSAQTRRTPAPREKARETVRVTVEADAYSELMFSSGERGT